MNRNQLTKIVEERDASPEEKAIKTVNTGIYCLSWNKIAPLLDKLSANNAQGELYLTDVIEIANQQGLRVGCVSLQDPNEMLGVNARTDLALCHKILNERSQQALMDAGVTIINPEQTMVAPEVSVGADTVIYPGCFLQGNITIGERCTLGPNTTLMGQVSIGDDSSVISSLIKDSMVGSRSTVGPFAHLRDGTYLSDHVRIGNFVEVKNTRIDHHTNAAHLAYLGDAVIGTGVNMGAGSITANYDPVRNEKHQTIIEDGVKVGCNAVLVAPVTIAHDSCVAAGSVITKNVEPWDLAIARPKQTQIPQWVAKIQRETTPTKS
jgi:bifunctional UDP-N-acetylglucosamine pyrophosphorylase/glucosamine-1-phosphate N-acetyltransferase